jgi:DNA-binding Lrp family transcriptional regulator
MVSAFVLINISDKDIKAIAERLLEVDGVTEVYPIVGEYDFICVVRVKDNSKLSEVVTEKIIHQPGIRHTKTLFALEAYSNLDLEGLFFAK